MTKHNQDNRPPEDLGRLKACVQDLEKREEKFRNLFETMAQGVIYHNADGAIISANPAAEKILGLPRDQLLGRTPADPRWRAIHADGSAFPGETHPSSLALKTGKDIKNVIMGVFNPMDKDYRWIEINAVPQYKPGQEKPWQVYTVFDDITGRKRAGNELRLNNKRLRMALEACHMGTWDWDMQADHLEWSPETHKIFGVGPEAFGGTCDAYLAFIPAEVRGTIDQAVKTLLAEAPASGAIHYDHPIITGDGQDRWIEVRGTLYRDDQGRLTRMTGICTDITDRKREETEKSYLQQQFHQAQKLESVGRLAGGVAHDLNNLLSPILGYGEMLLDQASADDPWKEPLEEILKAGFRARDLVRQLLTFSRKQALDFTSIDLNALLEDFQNLLRRTIREDIVIHMNLAPVLPTIKGDMGQLEQVVMNLAVNAQDAMPEGGRLTIETASVNLDEAYAAEHQSARPGPHAMLLVSDTGQGMDLQTRELIFEPFFTTKEVNAGTGLGLATVYGIVKQHRGNIWVYSEPGMGTTFKIYLPASDDQSGQEEPASQTVSDLSGSETILLVEDNEQVRNLALAILQHAGYTVLTAASGKEALSQLSHYKDHLHLLLTDVIMPEINGRQLFSRAVDAFPGLKVLYMSGYSNDVIAHHGVMEEGAHFIQKPFSIHTLAAKVREVLDR